MNEVKKIKRKGVLYWIKDEIARDSIARLQMRIEDIVPGVFNQLLADWNETDTSSPSYINNKPNIPTLDNYYTQLQVNGLLSNKQDKLIQGENISIVDNVISATGEINVDLSDYYTKTEIDGKGYLTQHQDISGKVDKEQGKSLFSGSYNDLTDKPDIPTNTSDLTNDNGLLTQTEYTAIKNNINTLQQKIDAIINIINNHMVNFAFENGKPTINTIGQLPWPTVNDSSTETI